MHSPCFLGLLEGLNETVYQTSHMLLIVLVGTCFVRGRHCIGPWGLQPVEQVSVCPQAAAA